MEDEIKKTYESIQYFRDIKPYSYQLLGYLGYNMESEFDAPPGRWTVYTKRDFSFPYFNSGFSAPVNRFAAVYRGAGKNMMVYGSFETKNTDEIQEKLEILTKTMLSPVQKFLGIPRTLTEENARDYGYIRGVIIGIILIIADFVYSWTFKLQEGILTGFIEYIKQVYYGNPRIGNFIGFAWTGFYFGIPLIAVPILYGNICVKMAEKSRQRKLRKMETLLTGYEFGVNAEKALEEELSTIIEEKKKEAIYGEIAKINVKLGREDFETLYLKIREGFLSPESIHYFITELKELAGEEMPFEKFVEIIARYQKTGLKTELDIKTT
ncbi:MAG: hypothetical protein JW957_02155 [Candidatus Omnitrophica bacterium]|nr:hypothetical protein [Candidatus Omnitrophota bacterium]